MAPKINSLFSVSPMVQLYYYGNLIKQIDFFMKLNILWKAH